MIAKKEYEEQQEEDDFRCPKCKWYFSTMTKPYILPCSHHICLKCIDQLILENRTICPICKIIFNKEERNTFQINIVFLNILIKILQSKMILCKNCNKVFYWKEHYNTCDQSFFMETNEMFNQIKITCEEGIKLIKLFNIKSNILGKYKSNIFNNIKKAIIEISDSFKKEINIGLKKLFITSNKIDFNKNKKEILSFLQICLHYKNYFDENEIINILQKYYPSYSPKKKIYHQNKMSAGISQKVPEPIPYSPYLEKKENLIPAKKTSTMMISQINKNNQGIILNKNHKQTNNFRIIKNTNYRNNNLNMREDQSLNMFNKMVNDNPFLNLNININNNINKYLNINNIDNNLNKFRQHLYIPRHNSNTVVFYNSSTKPKNKKNKFNIYDILNEDEPNEENDKKKIIVGLKDVKVVSSNKINKKQNQNENKSRNLIHRENKKSVNILDVNKNSYYQKINNNKMNEKSNNINLINDESSEASTVRIENPSLSLLRSTEFTKRIFPLKADDKRKKLLKYQQACIKNEKEQNLLKNKLDKINNDKNKVYKRNIISNSSSCLINKNNNINNDNEKNRNKIDLSSMNKLFKHFNKIRDIIIDMNNYNNFLNYISEYINKDVNFRINILKNIILTDYNLLLNEITYNFSQSYRHSIITFLENTKRITIYNTNLNKFKTKNFDKLLPQINYFDNSISIDYDDNDLIFISGGTEDSNYNCSNLFLILKWSTETVEYNGTLPERKAFHSTLYYDNKLYLIGGIDSNKKVSKECQLFSLTDKNWHNLPNLNVGRANSSICIYNNKVLYVFRGRNDNEVLDSIEYIKLFNLRSNWKLFKPIDYGYVWNSAENSLVMTIDKGKILICGGEDINGNLFKDTFLFETNTKKIYKGIDLVIPASFKNHGCCNQGKYFCIDIKNENNFNNEDVNVHIFDPKENIWIFD